MPEQSGEKSNHNNAKDKTLLVESRVVVVAGGQPVGIAHAKLLGRPPASQPHQTLIKDFLNRSLAAEGASLSQRCAGGFAADERHRAFPDEAARIAFHSA
jgi:hypothetical protein